MRLFGHSIVHVVCQQSDGVIFCVHLGQDKYSGNQGGPTQRASALAALSSAFNPSSGESANAVNKLLMSLLSY